jgi:glycosyltransferase involved in cell wall biosynthesis
MSDKISIVVPVYNEAESLPAFFKSLDAALGEISCEVVVVDDGSTDASPALLEVRAKSDPRLKVITFARNFGQTAAMAAGFDAARGAVVVCLDADGQNDPGDVPLLLAEIERGADVVSGWRHDRQDPWLSRKLPSALANGLISLVTGVSLHDYGCTLKAYRRAVLKDLRLYGEMHRFLPAWCVWKGAKVTEVKVRHHPRRLGKSKYGIGRTFKVVLDLMTAKFFASYLNKPSYFFGGLGMLSIFLGFLAGFTALLDKFVLNQWGPFRVPLIILSVFLGLLGTQFAVLGLLAEILIRIYYENKNERPYRIAKVTGLQTGEGE